eukprot:1133781-Amphidinium_carterae.1
MEWGASLRTEVSTLNHTGFKRRFNACSVIVCGCYLQAFLVFASAPPWCCYSIPFAHVAKHRFLMPLKWFESVVLLIADSMLSCGIYRSINPVTPLVALWSACMPWGQRQHLP